MSHNDSGMNEKRFRRGAWLLLLLSLMSAGSTAALYFGMRIPVFYATSLALPVVTDIVGSGHSTTPEPNPIATSAGSGTAARQAVAAVVGGVVTTSVGPIVAVAASAVVGVVAVVDATVSMPCGSASVVTARGSAAGPGRRRRGGRRHHHQKRRRGSDRGRGQ